MKNRKYRFWFGARFQTENVWQEFIKSATENIEGLGFKILNPHFFEPGFSSYDLPDELICKGEKTIISSKPTEFRFELCINDEEDKMFLDLMLGQYAYFDFFPVEGIDYRSWFKAK